MRIRIDKNNALKFICTLILPLLIFFTRPLKMNLNQSIILATLVLVLIWWTTHIVNRTYASIFLFLIFILFGATPLKVIFKFPLSMNFYMIAFSFLLSQGIVNSNVANRLSCIALSRYGNTPYKLIFMSFIFGIFMIFFIPQPFSRVILLASIYDQFFKERKIRSNTREVLIYSIFVASTSTSMIFLNGDIILNYSALQFGRTTLGWIEWARYMTVPSLLTSMIIGIAFILVFRKELKNVDLSYDKNDITAGKISSTEKRAIIIMSIVIILWMTEPFHRINSAIIALIGTLSMFIFKILELKDFKSLNVSLMIFLTSAFAIGSVMNQSGIANILYSKIIGVFPTTNSIVYFCILILTVMTLHMLLGSSITTLSVVVPGLIELTKGAIDIVPLILLVYIAVNIHYIFPFHHVTIMIGSGYNYYSNKVVIKYGIMLTFITFIVILAIYMPWWRFVNLV